MGPEESAAALEGVEGGEAEHQRDDEEGREGEQEHDPVLGVVLPDDRELELVHCGGVLAGGCHCDQEHHRLGRGEGVHEWLAE